MSKTPEDIVKDKVERYLKKLKATGVPLGIIQRRDAVGSNYKVGSADLWFTYFGFHFEVEFKAPDGRRSNLQIAWQQRCQKDFICSIFVDNCETFINWFEQVMANPPTPYRPPQYPAV